MLEFAFVKKREAGSWLQQRICERFREVGWMEGVGGGGARLCLGFMHSGSCSFKNM